MAAFTDYFENKLVDQIFRGQAYAFPATLYVGLLTAAPTDSAAGTEVVTGATTNYARVGVACSLANWAGTQGAGTTVASSGSSGGTSNNAAITFGAPTAAASGGVSWGSVQAVGIYDAPTGGNLLMYSTMPAKTVNAGDSAPSFAIGALTPQVDN